MSRYLETSVYSLDRKSIWDVSLKFERLGLQEVNRNSEIIYQGQDMTDSSLRDATSFKVDFDSFFSLYKKFYIKVVKGTQVLDDAIESELEAKFEADVAEEKAEQSVKIAISKFISDSFKPLTGTIGENTATISNYLDKIFNKIKKVSDQRNDSNSTKYAKMGYYR